MMELSDLVKVVKRNFAKDELVKVLRHGARLYRSRPGYPPIHLYKYFTPEIPLQEQPSKFVVVYGHEQGMLVEYVESCYFGLR